MTTTATLAYSAFLGGAPAADVIAMMDATEPPIEYLDVIGVRLVSDSAAGSNPVVDTVSLALVPMVTATATSSLIDKGASGSGVQSVAIGITGTGYTAPPVVTFTGGRPVAAANPGFPTHPIVESMLPESENQPAYAQAYLDVTTAAIVSGGGGYSAATFAEVTGPMQPGGVQAVVSLTIGGGGIVTGATVVSHGSGYTGPAVVTVVDPNDMGAGAAISVSMGVGKIDVLRSGGGYSSPPTVVLTPLFAALFPVGSDQAAPLKQLMTTALAQATIGPVSAAAPVIA